jgi:2,3-bisphosphoglycerate-dependent phosphoglycerate mutase
MATLVLLRHGESTWNKENRFTGWFDADLSGAGEAEAASAGRLLAADGVLPEVVHTSLQKRAIRTANLALDACDRAWAPVRRHWRLNERHYGDLQGLNKAETTARYGEEQVFQWRRSYHVPPPPLAPDDERHPRFDPRYAGLPPELLPASECLADVVARVLPYWYDAVVPDLMAGRVVLVAAHGNSLRALVKHLEGISDGDIAGINIPTGIPRVYELGEGLAVASARYLGDEEEARRKAEAVANQARQA